MTQSAQKRTRFEHWRIIGVTALPPGWRNVYRSDEGESNIIAQCPVVLTQELVHVVHVETGSSGEHVEQIEEMARPFEVRVVFAERDDFGGLEPACEVSNYVTTLSPFNP